MTASWGREAGDKMELTAVAALLALVLLTFCDFSRLLRNPGFLPRCCQLCSVRMLFWFSSQGFQRCTAALPSTEQVFPRERVLSRVFFSVSPTNMYLCVVLLPQTPFKFLDKDGMADVTSRTVVVRDNSKTRERGGGVADKLKGRPNSGAFILNRTTSFPRVACILLDTT